MSDGSNISYLRIPNEDVVVGLNTVTGVIPNNITSLRIDAACDNSLSSDENGSITLKAVKLELGSVSTLAMDTVPNYATELLKCQRYFVRLKNESSSYLSLIGIGYGRISGVTSIMLPISLPTIMRGSSAITFSENGVGYSSTASSVNELDNAISINGYNASGCIRSVFIKGDNITAEKSYMVFLKPNAYIDLSADL